MKEFNEYYQTDEIIKYLCKIRIRLAQKRHKKYLLDKLTSKEFYIKEIVSSYDDQIIKTLDEILPKRRLWLSNGQRTFRKINQDSASSQKVKIPSDKKNREILFNTIKKYQREKPTFDFVVKLNNFIKDIQDSIESESYKITRPNIFPEIKETNKSKLKLELKLNNAYECRPISRFIVKDRIILSLTNKFLTEIFDQYFEESSLAFRAKKDNGQVHKNHHAAVSKIIEFKKANKDTDLWVAECDLKKFYDTVNHNVCLTAFYKLIDKVRADCPGLNLQKAIYIFQEYLCCYSFKDNIDSELNGNEVYWKNQKDKKRKSFHGNYPWIHKEFINNEYYQKNPRDKIGVPQGGALSGLIANIVLDSADKKLKTFDKLFYVRYCDDMILMHANQRETQRAINSYVESIRELLLFNHPLSNEFTKPNKNYKRPFKIFSSISKQKSILASVVRILNIQINKIIVRFFKSKTPKRSLIAENSKKLHRSFEFSLKPFWNTKSKMPYKWGKINIENATFPWITFVGYEINYNCDTRVRKKSIRKELAKQQRVVTSIIKRFSKKKNARNRTIYKSATEKLNGMSVGRVKMYNYMDCKNEYCWTDGFQCLNLNKHSSKQLKALDRNKYKFLSILRQHLGPETLSPKESENNEEDLDFRKPFSYYFQAGEKKLNKLGIEKTENCNP